MMLVETTATDDLLEVDSLDEEDLLNVYSRTNNPLGFAFIGYPMNTDQDPRDAVYFYVSEIVSIEIS